MTTWRPLSRRDDPAYDEPSEGLPDHLFKPAWAWVDKIVHDGHTRPSEAVLEAVQLRLRLSLDWSSGVFSAARSLQEQMIADREVALDVLDFLLVLRVGANQADRLYLLLEAGGSVWGVGEGADGRKRLERRAPGPVAEAVERIQTNSDRAHHHLRVSWGALMGRNPDPPTAYREAVRAVEVAAKPVVSPANGLTTLGTVIRDLKAKPTKWAVGLDHGSTDQVIAMCELLWKGQTDRHGSDDPGAPLNVAQEEADSAFYLALPLVRLFTSGAVRRV